MFSLVKFGQNIEHYWQVWHAEGTDHGCWEEECGSSTSPCEHVVDDDADLDALVDSGSCVAVCNCEYIMLKILLCFVVAFNFRVRSTWMRWTTKEAGEWIARSASPNHLEGWWRFIRIGQSTCVGWELVSLFQCLNFVPDTGALVHASIKELGTWIHRTRPLLRDLVFIRLG